MTVRRGLSFAAVAALVAAAAAVLWTLGRAGLTAGTMPSPAPAAAPARASAAPAAVPAVTDSPAPTRPDSGPPPAKPGATAAVVPAATTPAPFVQHFADGPTASPLPRQKSPTAPLKVPAFVDGCDHNYGTTTQCVPLVFPGGVTGAEGKCAWLSAHGFTDLIVAGRDSQGLDRDGDGRACH